MPCCNLCWRKGTDIGGNWAEMVNICEHYGMTGNNHNHPHPQGCTCRTPGRCRSLFAESEGRHWNCDVIQKQSWRHNPDGGLGIEGNRAQSSCFKIGIPYPAATQVQQQCFYQWFISPWKESHINNSLLKTLTAYGIWTGTVSPISVLFN